MGLGPVYTASLLDLALLRPALTPVISLVVLPLIYLWGLKILPIWLACLFCIFVIAASALVAAAHVIIDRSQAR